MELQQTGRILYWLCLFAANAFYVHSSFAKYLEKPVIVDVYTRPIMSSDLLQITFGMGRPYMVGYLKYGLCYIVCCALCLQESITSQIIHNIFHF